MQRLDIVRRYGLQRRSLTKSTLQSGAFPAFSCKRRCIQHAHQPTSSRKQLQVSAMQSTPTGRSAPLPQEPKPGALVRRPSFAPVPQQNIYLEMSQVLNKQVITRTSGRNLGVVCAMWVDASRAEVVSLDLEEKKGVGHSRVVANIPLSRLTQIGDVVLVHDEQVLYEAPMDGRLGYMVLPGVEVRTVSGSFLGKVRDFTFNPDSGSINRVTYDDFGLSFLPTSFFDTYSLGMEDVVHFGPGGIVVLEQAKLTERRESSGIFAAIPQLLRLLDRPSGGAGSTLMLADSYRTGQQQQDVQQQPQPAGYLPQGYTTQQWMQDVQRWEQATGLSYEAYTQGLQVPRGQATPQQQQRPRALPSPGQASASAAHQQQQQYSPQQYNPQQQQQYGYSYGQQQQPQQQQYGQQQQVFQARQYAAAPPQQQQASRPGGPAAPPPQQQQQQPQPSSDPRYRGARPAQQHQPQQVAAQPQQNQQGYPAATGYPPAGYQQPTGYSRQTQQVYPTAAAAAAGYPQPGPSGPGGPQQPHAPGTSTPSPPSVQQSQAGIGRAPAAQQQLPQQQRAASTPGGGSSSVGTAGTVGAPATAAESASPASTGRRFDEYVVRDDRPRVQEVLGGEQGMPPVPAASAPGSGSVSGSASGSGSGGSTGPAQGGGGYLRQQQPPAAGTSSRGTSQPTRSGEGRDGGWNEYYRGGAAPAPGLGSAAMHQEPGPLAGRQ